MRAIEHFLPGSVGDDGAVVARLRWPIPAGVARAYVEVHSAPGDLVLVPYCQGPAEVAEIVAAGRRGLALHFDPAVLMAVEGALYPLAGREVLAAVTRLGESLKHGLPLGQVLADLYATPCPACGRPAVADWFLWERDAQEPLARYVRCAGCEWNGQAAIGAEDRDRLRAIPARGLHYHFVLDRVSPPADEEPLRRRLETLLKQYTPRNLYALAELTLKIESLFPAGPIRRSLLVLLLDCLDRGSSLWAPPPAGRVGSGEPRRSWTRPALYLERNVWAAFQEVAARRGAAEGAGTLPTAATPEALLNSFEPAAYLGPGLVRDLSRRLAGGSVRLILFSPPPLEPGAWALSYFWGAWLLGEEAASALRPLLRQRMPDQAWYAEVMGGSLRALAGLLRRDGRLVLVLSGQRTGVLEALLSAAGSARLGVAALQQSGAGYRLEFAPDAFRSRAGGLDIGGRPALERSLRDAAVVAAQAAIRARGEPVPWRTLHAAIYRALAHDGWLEAAQAGVPHPPQTLALLTAAVREALDDPSLQRLAGATPREDLWWLAPGLDPGPAPALADRVEAAAHQILCSAARFTEAEFATSLHERFPGMLAPSPELVAACLRAFAQELPDGGWQLRAEDRPAAREAERAAMIDGLGALGRRLGYHAGHRPPFDLAWWQGGRVQSAFLVRWLLPLGDLLPLAERAPGIRPYLVFPGGRAALLSHKLARNPLWQSAVEEGGWGFVKYRHVRELLAAAEVDEYSLRAVVSLDPPVEGESVQLALF